jgi:hypothetical protein
LQWHCVGTDHGDEFVLFLDLVGHVTNENALVVQVVATGKLAFVALNRRQELKRIAKERINNI